MGMDLFRPPSVFSYFSPSRRRAGGGRRARPGVRLSCRPPPRCAAPTSSTRWCSRRIAVSANAPTGTSLDLSDLQRARGDARCSSSTRSTAAAARHDVDRDARRPSSGGDRRPGHQSAEARPHRPLSRRVVVAVSGGESSMRVTRREFLFQTAQGCVGYALGAAAFVAGVQRFGLINAAGAGLRLQGAGLRVPGRRQRRQQHGRAAHDTTEYNAYATARSIVRAGDRAATRCCRSLRSASAVRSGCIRASPSCQTLWNQQKLSVVCNVGPLVQPLTREALPGRRAASVSAVLALRSGRAVADVDRRSGRCRPGGAAAPPIASRRRLGLPDGHGAVGRHLHARPDDLAALDCAGADGAEPGARAERVRHHRRRSGAAQRDGFAARDRQRIDAGRPPRAGRRSRRIDIGRLLNSRRVARRRCFRTRRSATS